MQNKTTMSKPKHFTRLTFWQVLALKNHNRHKVLAAPEEILTPVGFTPPHCFIPFAGHITGPKTTREKW